MARRQPFAKLSVLSIITGGGKWVEITIPAESMVVYHSILSSAKKFLDGPCEKKRPHPSGR
jgi:hypothetical protein